MYISIYIEHFYINWINEKNWNFFFILSFSFEQYIYKNLLVTVQAIYIYINVYINMKIHSNTDIPNTEQIV